MSSNLESSAVGVEGGIIPLKTKRGKEFLEHQHYLFNLEKSTILKNKSIKQYWKCIHRKCPARMHVTLVDGLAANKIVEGNPIHDPTVCQPCKDEITQMAVRQEIIDLVEQGSLSLNEAYDEVKTKFMEICPEMSNVLPTKKSLQSLCIRRKSNSKRGEDEMDFNQDDVTENGRGGLIKRTHLEARLRLTQSQDSNNLFDNQLQTHVSSSSSSSMGGPNQDISNAMPNWLIKSIDAAINNVTKPLVERVRILEQRVQLLERVQSGPPASEATTTTSSSNDGVAVVEKRHKFSTAAK